MSKRRCTGCGYIDQDEEFRRDEESKSIVCQKCGNVMPLDDLGDPYKDDAELYRYKHFDIAIREMEDLPKATRCELRINDTLNDKPWSFHTFDYYVRKRDAISEAINYIEGAMS